MAKYLGIAILAGIVAVLYCCCRAAAEADRQMERLFREWREKHNI